MSARNGKRRAAIAGAAALAVGVGVGRFVYTPILPAMQIAFGWDRVLAGWIGSAHHAGYLLGAMLMTFSSRRYDSSRLLTGALWVVVISLGAMAVTTEVLWWSVARFVAGLAGAVVFVLGADLAFRAVGEAWRNWAAGWIYAGVGFGITLTALSMGLAGGLGLSWRYQWVVAAGLTAGLSVLARSGVDRHIDVARPAEGSGASAGLTSIPFALLALAYLIEGAAYIVLATFVVAELETLSVWQGSGWQIWALLGLTAMLSMPIGSVLSSRIGVTTTLVLFFLLQAAGTAAPSLLAPTIGLPLAAVVLGATFMVVTAFALVWGRALCPGRPAAALAVLTIAFGLGQIAGSPTGGWLLEHWGSLAWLVIASALLAAAGLVVVAARLVTNTESSRA